MSGGPKQDPELVRLALARFRFWQATSVRGQSSVFHDCIRLARFFESDAAASVGKVRIMAASFARHFAAELAQAEIARAQGAIH